MGTADKGGSDEAPQVGGKPAEHGGGGDGADDGAGAGDGCEMVAQKNRRVGRAVVDTVKHSFGRGLVVITQTINTRHVGTVHLITNCKQDDGNNKQGCEHLIHLRKI
ncbi:hypothetical protein SDC9_132473 [bioreactor metagenome]|uniref:Uncharacterized protein n=1 Tax=bioreactor metagenome TaxID=1076179 RepID=A0A645D8W8_9ZZZZ